MLIIYDCETGSVTEKNSKKLLSYLERRYKLNMDNLKKKYEHSDNITIFISQQKVM